MAEQILKTEFSDIMQQSYIDYSMSVITARAVPDVRDGLKPVQRRVLYAMNELGLNYDKPHRKSARIVGDTMGKYHPHGDSSIYDALVVLEQDFKKGMALVDGHGNFGSIEGDGAAAMRYTEAKLKKFTQEVYLADLDKNVVDYTSNFDETEKEPVVLPVRVPNLLINGAEGIAVGMTTSIPSHNLGEVIDAVKSVLDNDDVSVKDLMKYVKGPDFPTGGIVTNKKDLLQIYETGQGKIKIRGTVVFEPGQKRADKDKLVITEIPYPMIGANIQKFMQDVVTLIENKTISEITDISNQSSKDGIRIVLELKKNADVERLKNILYKKTKLEDTFGVNMLAIVDNRPRVLSLKEIIEHHVDFQFELASRKYRTLLDKDLEQKEIKEGLIKAYDIIDLIIEVLRGSKSLKEAKLCLTTGETGQINFKTKQSKSQASKLHFTDRQAQAILEMRLMRLIGLEILALESEYNELLKRIAEFEDILENRSSMVRVIKADLTRIKKEYSLKRKTVITDAAAVAYEEQAFEEQDIVFLMDRFGYAKTIDVSTYERNKDTILEENRYVLPCKNTEKVCIFTDTGQLHQVKLLDIPHGKFRDKGQPIDNLGNYDSNGESIVLVITSNMLEGKSLLFATRFGLIKLVAGTEFQVTKRTVAATKLGAEDQVAAVKLLEVLDDHIILQTKNGVFLKFNVADVPEKKKSALGVRAMKLVDDDQIEMVYMTNNDRIDRILYKEKEIIFSKLKLGKRDTKGVKVRI